MPTHDDLDVSDSDDNDDSSTMVSDNHSVTHSHTPQAPVSDLDFVAALAQAEIDLIHSTTAGTGDECENDEVDECANMEEVNVESEDSSSSDDDDDDVSENGAIKAMANSDDEFDAPVSSAIPRTKNEIGADDIDVEVEKVELLEDEKLDLVGTVMSVVPSEHTIVIQSITTQTPLDEGSVLCLGDRKVIGKISELFGPLSAPFYIVKHKSSPTHSDENSEGVETADENSTGKRKTELAHIDDIQQGVSVFVAVQHSSYVTPHSLSIIRNIKGSDASNMWDEEIGEDEKEFSDDEQEAAYRKSKKNNKRNVNGSNNNSSISSGQQENFNSRPQYNAGRGAQHDKKPAYVREGYNHTQGTVVSERAAGYGHLAVGQTTAPPCGTTNLSLNAYPSRPGMQGAGVSLGLQQQQHPPSYSYGSSHMGVPLGTTALPPPAAFIPPPQPFQWPSASQMYQQPQHPQGSHLGGQLHQQPSTMYNQFSPMHQQAQYQQQQHLQQHPAMQQSYQQAQSVYPQHQPPYQQSQPSQQQQMYQQQQSYPSNNTSHSK